jgi:hypothetical protein
LTPDDQVEERRVLLPVIADLETAVDRDGAGADGAAGRGVAEVEVAGEVPLVLVGAGAGVLAMDEATDGSTALRSSKRWSTLYGIPARLAAARTSSSCDARRSAIVRDAPPGSSLRPCSMPV